nr:ATP-binding protein [Candidatus Njordarchaeum guaymaensis]
KELKEAQERLLKAERMAAIGETAAMVGHDLRNPLQVISNLLYLGKNMVKEIPPRCREILSEMGIEELFGNVAKQIEYMNKIVSDLQDYAKPLRPELVPTSLYQLINETLSVLTIPETVKVSTEIPKDFPNIIVDPSLMRRLFTNLLTNALQAMPDGGQLTIRSEPTENATIISIEDTGVGIPKENLDKLFQPLFTTKPRGTGFGLPVCKRIVEAHKGSINVESELGRGSTFTVSIPHTREVSQTG